MMIQAHDEDDVAAAASQQAKPASNGYPAKPKISDTPDRSLFDVCVEMREMIDAFLAGESGPPILRNVREQLRVSMGIVDEALKRYQCVFLQAGCQIAEPANC
jgi:FAD synthetase